MWKEAMLKQGKPSPPPDATFWQRIMRLQHQKYFKLQMLQKVLNEKDEIKSHE